MGVDKIFKSRTRRAILRLCFTNPDKKYYLRELERLLGIPVSMIRKELLRLEKDGTFRSERVANLTYFYPNKSYLLYDELRSIVFKTIGIQGFLRDVLQKIKNVEVAFIYGSFARGDAGAESDINLFIIGNPGERELFKKLRNAEKVLKRTIDTSLYSRAEFNRKKSQNDPLLMNILRDRKIFLVGAKNV